MEKSHCPLIPASPPPPPSRRPPILPILPLPKPKPIIAQSSSETKLASALATAEPEPDAVKCPYCAGSEVVKRGLRKKKLETVQLYFCHHCQKTFVWQRVKGRKFPLRIILEGLSLYNLGWGLEESCLRLKEQFGLIIDPSTLAEQKADFSLEKLIIREKQNFATRLAELVLQAVSDNKLRHRTLQDFMLANDSVTVAAEVPVYMDQMDIEHMQEELKFKIPLKLDRVLTGHIDILQLRNGAVHILDYKPGAAAGKKSASVTQLTLYALALSRLTGLRLYDFKCAWFDENSYFEFFPLHVVYKLKERAAKEHPDQVKMFEEENSDVIQTQL